jgi:hypothetical protein
VIAARVNGLLANRQYARVADFLGDAQTNVPASAPTGRAKVRPRRRPGDSDAGMVDFLGGAEACGARPRCDGDHRTAASVSHSFLDSPGRPKVTRPDLLLKASEPNIRYGDSTPPTRSNGSTTIHTASQINAAISQLASGDIGVDTFLWWMELIHPPSTTPVRFAPPFVVDCLEFCASPELDCADGVTDIPCECPDAIAETPTIDALDFGPEFGRALNSTDSELFDVALLLEGAFEFLLQNIDVIEWLECLLGIKAGCISEFIADATPNSVLTDLAFGEVTVPNPDWITITVFGITITVPGLPIKQGIEPSEGGTNPFEMTKDGTLVGIAAGDDSGARSDTFWAWMSMYQSVLSLPATGELGVEREGALACVLAQVAASMLGALAAGLGCVDHTECDSAENRIMNAFLWAMTERYPCILTGAGCDTDDFLSGGLFMNPDPPPYIRARRRTIRRSGAPSPAEGSTSPGTILAERLRSTKLDLETGSSQSAGSGLSGTRRRALVSSCRLATQT